MGNRRLAREYCLKALYLADCGLKDEELELALADSASMLDEETVDFGRQLALGAIAILPEIDSIIEKLATNWRLSRMPAVDRAILRMAVYELEKVPGTPPLAVIDEAIELAKRYSTDNSGAFVNGILDRARQARDGSGSPAGDKTDEA
jgi:N utilization substance protein B